MWGSCVVNCGIFDRSGVALEGLNPSPLELSTFTERLLTLEDGWEWWEIFWWWIPSSVRLNLGSALIVWKKDLQYKLSVHLRLNVFNYEPNLIPTELEYPNVRERVSYHSQSHTIILCPSFLESPSFSASFWRKPLHSQPLYGGEYRGTSLIRNSPPP